MACSLDDLKKTGPVGPAMILLHFVDDYLFESGPKNFLMPIFDDSKKT